MAKRIAIDLAEFVLLLTCALALGFVFGRSVMIAQKQKMEGPKDVACWQTEVNTPEINYYDYRVEHQFDRDNSLSWTMTNIIEKSSRCRGKVAGYSMEWDVEQRWIKLPKGENIHEN